MRSFHIYLLALLGAVLLLGGGIASTTAVAQGAVVYPEPNNVMLANGELRQIAVRLDGAENVYGVHVELQFDPRRVQIVDPETEAPAAQIAVGDFFQEEGFVARNIVDNEAGTLLYAFTLLNPAVPVTGDGSLIVFTVKGVGGGPSGLEFISVKLSTPDGKPVPFTMEELVLTVDGEVIDEAAPANPVSAGNESSEADAVEDPLVTGQATARATSVQPEQQQSDSSGLNNILLIFIMGTAGIGLIILFLRMFQSNSG